MILKNMVSAGHSSPSRLPLKTQNEILGGVMGAFTKASKMQNNTQTG